MAKSLLANTRHLAVMIVITVSLIAACGLASAQTGVLAIDADRAELDEAAGSSVYLGNVNLTQDGIALSGNRLTITRTENRDLRATMIGNPARLQHTPPGSDRTVVATAGRLVYDTTSRLLVLEESARIARGADRLSAERIEYDLANQRVKASGGDSGRVRITIPAPGLPASESDDETGPPGADGDTP